MNESYRLIDNFMDEISAFNSKNAAAQERNYMQPPAFSMNQSPHRKQSTQSIMSKQTLYSHLQNKEHRNQFLIHHLVKKMKKQELLHLSKNKRNEMDGHFGGPLK